MKGKSFVTTRIFQFKEILKWLLNLIVAIVPFLCAILAFAGTKEERIAILNEEIEQSSLQVRLYNLKNEKVPQSLTNYIENLKKELALLSNPNGYYIESIGTSIKNLYKKEREAETMIAEAKLNNTNVDAKTNNEFDKLLSQIQTLKETINKSTNQSLLKPSDRFHFGNTIISNSHRPPSSQLTLQPNISTSVATQKPLENELQDNNSLINSADEQLKTIEKAISSTDEIQKRNRTPLESLEIYKRNLRILKEYIKGSNKALDSNLIQELEEFSRREQFAEIQRNTNQKKAQELLDIGSQSREKVQKKLTNLGLTLLMPVQLYKELKPGHFDDLLAWEFDRPEVLSHHSDVTKVEMQNLSNYLILQENNGSLQLPQDHINYKEELNRNAPRLHSPSNAEQDHTEIIRSNKERVDQKHSMQISSVLKPSRLSEVNLNSNSSIPYITFKEHKRKALDTLMTMTDIVPKLKHARSEEDKANLLKNLNLSSYEDIKVGDKTLSPIIVGNSDEDKLKVYYVSDNGVYSFPERIKDIKKLKSEKFERYKLDPEDHKGVFKQLTQALEYQKHGTTSIQDSDIDSKFRQKLEKAVGFGGEVHEEEDNGALESSPCFGTPRVVPVFSKLFNDVNKTVHFNEEVINFPIPGRDEEEEKIDPLEPKKTKISKLRNRQKEIEFGNFNGYEPHLRGRYSKFNSP